MIDSKLIVDSLSDSRVETLKVHMLESILRDIEAELQFSAYCYYCEICEEILALSKNFIEPGSMRWTFHDRCPSCNWGLESNLRCLRIKVPSKTIFQFHPQCRKSFSTNLPTKPHKKSVISYLFEENEPLLERELQPFCGDLIENSLEGGLGRFTVLHGDHSAHELSESICVKAQMPTSCGGLNSKVIFIDGGNLFDPYLISCYADRYQIRRETVLDRIHVGRAFTCYQLTSLIMKTLPDALERYDAKLAVIADIARLYMDSDVEEHEAFETINQISAFLGKLAEKTDTVILATYMTTLKHNWFESILLSRAHTVFRIQDKTKLPLEKQALLEW